MSRIIVLSGEDCDYLTSLLHEEAQWETQADRLVDLFEQDPAKHTIRIVVDGGDVQNVESMPMGLDYEVQDFDKCSDCGQVEPLCDWCMERL